MANANITTIIAGLAVVTTDSTATDDFQEDVIFELARGAYSGVLAVTDAAFVAVTADTARYAIPTGSNARIPLAIFYDTEQLWQLRKDEAWMLESEWRNSPANHVIGYVLDPEDRTAFSLVPPPHRAGDTIGASVPTGTTFPNGVITVIYTESDTAFAGTTYADLLLPIALECLSRELARDSNHQDKTAANAAHSLAEFFFAMFQPMGRTT